jgi:hypothetical protein
VVTVLKPAVDAIYDVRSALRKIEQLARISKVAADPDSGLADALVSSFEDEERQRRAERGIT